MGVPLHPTQLYEFVLEIANCIFLVWLVRRKKFEGQVIGTYLIIYGIGRYFIEFFRGDPGRGQLFGFMTDTQGIALLLVVAGGLLWLRRVPLRQTAKIGLSAVKAKTKTATDDTDLRDRSSNSLIRVHPRQSVAALFVLVWSADLLLFRRLLVLDGQQLDVENQRRIRADLAARAAFAVSQIRRNVQLPLGSDRHQLQRLGPALDDLPDRERRGLAALVRAIELRAVDQRAAVVGNDGVAGGRLGSVTLLDDLVLQAAGQRDHAVFRLVGREELLANLLVRVRRLRLALACCFFIISARNAVMTVLASSSVMSGLAPVSASFKARAMIAGSTSSESFLMLSPMFMPMA